MVRILTLLTIKMFNTFRFINFLYSIHIYYIHDVLETILGAENISISKTDRDPCHQEAYILMGWDQDYTKYVGKLYDILEDAKSYGEK